MNSQLLMNISKNEENNLGDKIEKISIFTTYSKQIENLPEPQNVYCQAALFCCNCCNYETEIYYDEDFF